MQNGEPGGVERVDFELQEGALLGREGVDP